MTSRKHSSPSSFPVCPSCGASNYRKAGRNSSSNRPMLRCRSCGRSWTLDNSVDMKSVELGLTDRRSLPATYIPDHIRCVRCHSHNLGFAGWAFRKSGKVRRVRCKDCEKYFVCPELNDVPLLQPRKMTTEERSTGECPRCGENKIGSGGKNKQGNKLLHCKTCDFRWVANPQPREAITGLVCPDCGQRENFVKGGWENELQRYICKQCRCTFVPTEDFVPQCPDCGSMRYKTHGYYSDKRYYRCQDCDRCYSSSSKAKVSDDPLVIDSRNFGVSKQYHQCYKIDLNDLSPKWLRTVVHKYIVLRLSRGDLRFQTLRNRASLARVFGSFLEKTYPGIQSHEIDRNLMLDFYTSDWWRSTNSDTNRKFLVFIKDLFSYIEEYGWDTTSGSLLIFREDYPKRCRMKSRHIPELVMKQIFANLHELPEPFQRAIVVLSETGIRFSELASLKQDCLEKSAEGTWWLNFYQSKMDKEHRIPVRGKCAVAIQEQLSFVQDVAPGFDFLFCGRSTQHRWVAKPIHIYTFNKTIQKWATSSRILDSSGKVWNLTSHQFRHTLATRMVNAGVAIPIVQRYLGHETSQMTQHYAHLHDQTLKNEFKKYYEGLEDD